MQSNNLEAKLLIVVVGYHPTEKLASKVGRKILRHPFGSGAIKAVLYDGKPDKGGSSHNLRRFIEKIGPARAIIIHSDDNLGKDALIFYRVRSHEEKRLARKILTRFSADHEKKALVFFDLSTILYNAKASLIDIELGSKMKPEVAVNLIKDFAQHLADNYM